MGYSKGVEHCYISMLIVFMPQTFLISLVPHLMKYLKLMLNHVKLSIFDDFKKCTEYFSVQRISNDLLIAFVHELDGYNILSYPYQMHNNKSVVIVSDMAAFEIYDIAHEVGHVLGAGHTPDPGK